jgi:tRNA(Ile)-lysidine synthase
MDALAETLLIRCRAPEGGTAGNDAGVLLCRRLRKEPLAARRRALRLWLQRRGVPAAALDFGAVDRIERLLERPRGSGVVPLAGGWTVRRSYDRLAAEHRARARRSRFRAAVRIPGETVVAGPGLRVTAAFSPGVRREKPAGPGQLPAGASLSAARIGRHALYVRSWRTGDRMKPLGLGGHKKLQDIFVDEKVPADRRSQVPIFECRRQIVWLPGYRVADGWEVRPGDELALQLAVARV